VEEINAAKEKEQIEEVKKEEAKKEVLPPEGSSALRAAPTRPSWSMSGGKQPEIVPETEKPLAEDKKPETVKPADAAVVKPAQAQENATTYKVQKGDSLAKIAKKHKVSLNKLLEINSMDRSSIIRIGQEIAIPAADPNAEVSPAPAVAPKTESANVETEELGVYVVQKGDYLGKIAAKHKTSVKQLMAINGLKNHNIQVGQKLKVSKSAAAAAEKAEKKAEEKPAAQAAADGEVSHTVKSGETLGAIALKYGTSVKAIMERNSIKDARKLKAGQTLIIAPRKSGAEKQKAAEKPAEKAEAPAPKQAEQKPAEAKPAEPAITVSPEAAAAPEAPAKPAAPADSNLPVVEL
ncbi:MAG: LysM peptidoglycan-binding domain-containing protein, partial [Opitutales bacterium]|nr:LysM peptidoglycan-binding domain-containing protein [Opitutales bacterium]